MAFRIALTHDFLTPSGEIAMGDIGLGMLQETPHVQSEFLSEFFAEMAPRQIADYDAIISLAPAYTKRTLAEANQRLSIVARVGVGYDMLDLDALSDRNVIVTITPDGVRRPMASGIASLVLALAHQLLPKDKLVRSGGWKEKVNIKSVGLTGLTLGSVGLGNIGREMFRVLQPYDMVQLASDPFVSPEEAAKAGVRLVGLETLMRESDFLCVNCPLTPQTRHMIGSRELAWMKPTAFFISTSRGAIVDQAALCDALKSNRIRGAALDVFETEPMPTGDPLRTLDNVILTPHSLCWTDECFRLMGESAIQSTLDVLQGKVPPHVVNRAVLEKPEMHAKLDANRARWNRAIQGNGIGLNSNQADPA